MFLQKSFIGKNAWFLYVAVLVLVFVFMQLGSVPYVVYAAIENMDAVQAGDASALSTPSDNMGLALMLLSFVVALGALVLFAKDAAKEEIYGLYDRAPALGFADVSASGYWPGAY